MLQKVLQTNIRSEIRTMDKLMRRANSQYPRISPYRVSQRAGNKSLKAHYVEWINKVGEIVDLQRTKDEGKPFLDIISDGTKALKKNKLGDCAESSSLIMSSLLANGYKDGRIARLFFVAEAQDLNTGKVVGKKIFDTTHEFVVRNLDENARSSEPKTYGKNLIIIDAWEGFCGNLQESLKRYYDTFWGGMREWINKESNLKISYKPIFEFLNLGHSISEQNISRFESEFPELLIK